MKEIELTIHENPTYSGYLIKTNIDPRRRAHELMERNEYAYSVIYLPLIAAEVVWEFADTVIDGLVILKDAALKDVTRKLRENRREYLHTFRSQLVDLDNLKIYADRFIDHINDGRAVTKEIFSRMKEEGIDPGKDRRGLVIAAHVAYCFAYGLKIYSEKRERRFAELAGLPSYGSILPESFYEILPLMKRVIGEDAVSGQVTSRIALQILDLLDLCAEELEESEERMRYSQACVAYRNCGGCRAEARHGNVGCYLRSKCKRMIKYDNLKTELK